VKFIEFTQATDQPFRESILLGDPKMSLWDDSTQGWEEINPHHLEQNALTVGHSISNGRVLLKFLIRDGYKTESLSIKMTEYQARSGELDYSVHTLQTQTSDFV
jgi:hypothetical protein